MIDKLKYKHLYWILAIFAALSFDQLFWEQPGGINFFIFILLAVLGGLLPIWLGKIPIPWPSYLLLLPALSFAFLTALRSEPLTTLMNGLLTFGSLMLFAISLRNGAWFQYEIETHLVNIFKFALNSMIGGILFFTKQKAKGADDGDPTVENNPNRPEKSSSFKTKFLPVFRGILLALPVLAVFSWLLAGADPVFRERILRIFTWFNIEKLDEYVFRLFYIVVIAYVLLGSYYFGAVKSTEISPTGEKTRLPKKWIGMVESGIILGAVNLLFLAFVILQFTYLFGGDQNVTIEGFTYSEYARRGFFELLVVALFSVILFFVLSRITRQENKKQRWIFTVLCLALVALVVIILLSAYTRLTLYEDAYGFTRLRTFTHVFIFWTAAVLIALAVLEITQNMPRLPAVLILFLFAFGATVNILDVDRFIVDQNILRAIAPPEESLTEVDAAYLSGLSYDSITPLAAYYQDDQTPEQLKKEIGRILACRLATLNEPEPGPWTSWHISRSRAITQLQQLEEQLADYRVFHQEDPWGWFVEIDQETLPCHTTGMDW